MSIDYLLSGNSTYSSCVFLRVLAAGMTVASGKHHNVQRPGNVRDKPTTELSEIGQRALNLRRASSRIWSISAMG